MLTGDTDKLDRMIASFRKGKEASSDLVAEMALEYTDYMLDMSGKGIGPYGEVWPMKRTGERATLGSIAERAAIPVVTANKISVKVKDRKARIHHYGGRIRTKAAKATARRLAKTGKSGKARKGGKKVLKFGPFYRASVRIPSRPFMLGSSIPAGLSSRWEEASKRVMEEHFGDV